MNTQRILAATASVVLGSCGGAPKGSGPDLQLYAVENPSSLAAQRALVRDWLESGKDGAALRSLLRIPRSNLDKEERKHLRYLLLTRARIGIAWRDPGARDAFELVRKLGAEGEQGLASQVMQTWAAAILRSTDERQHPRAWSVLRERVSSATGAEVGMLLVAHGARKAALDELGRYVEGGGADPDAVREWEALRHWWYGELGRPNDGEALNLVKESIRVERRWQEPGFWEASGDGLRLHDDRARAERQVAEIVEREVYPAPILLVLAERLYRRHGAEAALNPCLEASEDAPGQFGFQLAAAICLAAAGEAERALLHAYRGVASSGVPGQAWALLAAAFRRHGQPLLAVEAAKEALRHLPADRHPVVLAELVAAQEELGRDDEVRSSRQQLSRRLQRAGRPAAMHELEARVRAKGSGLFPNDLFLGVVPTVEF